MKQLCELAVQEKIPRWREDAAVAVYDRRLKDGRLFQVAAELHGNRGKFRRSQTAATSPYGFGLALPAAAGDPAGATDALAADCGAAETPAAGAEPAGEAAVTGDVAAAGDVPGATDAPGLAAAGET